MKGFSGSIFHRFNRKWRKWGKTRWRSADVTESIKYRMKEISEQETRITVMSTLSLASRTTWLPSRKIKGRTRWFDTYFSENQNQASFSTFSDGNGRSEVHQNQNHLRHTSYSYLYDPSRKRKSLILLPARKRKSHPNYSCSCSCHICHMSRKLRRMRWWDAIEKSNFEVKSLEARSLRSKLSRPSSKVSTILKSSRKAFPWHYILCLYLNIALYNIQYLIVVHTRNCLFCTQNQNPESGAVNDLELGITRRLIHTPNASHNDTIK